MCRPGPFPTSEELIYTAHPLGGHSFPRFGALCVLGTGGGIYMFRRAFQAVASKISIEAFWDEDRETC
jgi:hypothetical protein